MRNDEKRASHVVQVIFQNYKVTTVTVTCADGWA